MKDEIINKFFVYGTLRPDIQAPWTDIVHKNDEFTIRSYKAFATNAILQLFRNYEYPNVTINYSRLSEKDIVHGYILETSNINKTLKILDEIEGYPFEYDRMIIKCYNEDKQKYEKAYIYTIKERNTIMESVYNCEFNDMKLYLDNRKN